MIPPTEEEKQHMLDLVEEIRNIVNTLAGRTSRPDKLKAADRLTEIKNEMIAFRRKYPYA
jgi:hypothetical protein